MTSFKQEAPSPTNDVNNFHHISKQNHQSNNSNNNAQNHGQQSLVVQQNNVNNLSDTTLHQLLEQNGYNTFIEGKLF